VGVGVAKQFPRKQGEIEHQYDHLVKNVKKKDGQRKGNEGIDDEGEIDHDYHVLDGPGDDYDYPKDQERDDVYHVLDGPTPIEPELKTFQNRPNMVYPGELPKINSNGTTMHDAFIMIITIDGGVSVGGATQFPWKQKACEHEYDHLIKAAKKKGGQSKGSGTERDHQYHVLEGPLGNDVDDYDYPAEREGPEIVYHVLDGPTPVEEETQFIY
jgi:predicted DNA-binding WGR domain protein